jgi:hypothetical protein
MFNVSSSDPHVRFFVARDGYDETMLWADTAHPMHACDTCAADNRFMWGPAVVLAKRDTVSAVWSAACRVLLNRDTAQPLNY